MRKTIQNFKPVIEALSEGNIDLIRNFFVGEKAFDDFIKEEAINDMISGDGVTYLIINEVSKREIVAYYTISSSSIHTIDRYDFEDEDVPQDEKREHFSPISAFLIKMFAVNEKYQDTYYNDELVASLILKNIIFDLYDMSTSVVGAKRIILCAVEKAKKFYKLNNFKEFDDNYTLFDKIDAQDNYPMYLALHNV
ncbi:MAG: hypothetical protein KHZ99_05975 [Clostridium sp.]|uniref:hypothetical protein n=1 Tax=Clostridium sp. TaxID=1506 RepID=UPI0025B932C3|nr:hypothetical protein [Clostridium sp.]MBS4956578.1 hypothetical protein [Clostridium sp.]